MKNESNKLLRDLLGLWKVRFINMGYQYWKSYADILNEFVADY